MEVFTEFHGVICFGCGLIIGMAAGLVIMVLAEDFNGKNKKL